MTTLDSREEYPVKKIRSGTRLALTILFALAVFIPWGFSQNSPAVTGKSADEQEIYALVIRSQMQDWIRSGDDGEAEAKSKSDKAIATSLNFRIFFISINHKDPSDDFMNRFRDIPRTMKKISSAQPDKGPHTPVDKSTQKAGIIFSVDSILWSDQDSAEVQGGYYCGGLCAAGITFSVRREDGKWVIKSSKMNWIS